MIRPKSDPKTIKILPDELINRIAAGEIVERPASVVKEVLENSIDADASRIEISLVNGGKSYISVTDDGIGMSKDQALLAFERNATSKISSLEDLNNITTMGFRGEALPSIASVSRVIMKTRSRGKDAGVRIEIDNGKIISVQTIGCPYGTNVEVHDLFKKVPARLNTLKNTSTEFKHIQRCIGERLLANPELHITLSHNNKNILDSPAFGNFKDKLQHFLGDKTISEGIFFQRFDEETDIKIKGFLGSPFYLRKTKSNQFFFVNKRAVNSKLLSSAVYNAYQPFIPDNKEHPVFVIFIESPPYFVDVNVHPTKYEVRFKNSNQIYRLLVETVGYHLNTADFKPTFYRDNLKYEHKMKEWSRRDERYKPQANHFARYPDYSTNSELIRQEKGETEIPQINLQDNGALVPLSQFQNTYIIAKGNNKVILIDQHTAHERILYERFSKELREEKVPSQKFLFPPSADLSPEDTEILMNNIDIINASGFEVEHKSGSRWLIKAAPVLLHEEELEKSFLNLLDDIKLEGFNIDRERLIDKMAKTLACHSAVRSGEELTREKMKELLHLLNQTDTPSVCPHGRPTMVELSLDEIKKIFKRK